MKDTFSDVMNGSVCLISGATSGVGKAIAERLARRHATVLRVLFTYELARRIEGTGVTANAFYPGQVKTRLFRHAPWWGRLISGIVRPFLMNRCDTGVFVASSPSLETVSGKYLVGTTQVSFLPKWADASTLRRLWRLSSSLMDMSER